MKIHLKLMLLVFIASSFFNISYAEDAPTKIGVLYANGVLNDSLERAKSLQKLQRRLKGLYVNKAIPGLTGDDFKTVTFDEAVNKSELKDSLASDYPTIIKVPQVIWGLFTGALEVIVDYGQEWPDSLFDAFMVYLSDDDEEQAKNISENEGLMRRMQLAYSDVIQNLEGLTDDDLKEQYKQYRRLFGEENRCVITFAHSHGNMITRKVYNHVIDLEYIKENSDVRMKDCFYLMSVGSPVKMEMADDFLLDLKDPIGYLSTIDWSDKVNKNQPDKVKDENGKDINHHSFASYMKKTESSARIDKFLIDSVKSIANEDVELESNIIEINGTGILTTGGAADIEFEITEVSYKDAEGQELDSQVYADTMTDSTLHNTLGVLKKSGSGGVSYHVDMKYLSERTEITLKAWNKTGETVQLNYDTDATDIGEIAIIDFMPYYNRDFIGSDVPYFMQFGHKLIITRIGETNQYNIEVERLYPDYDRTIDIRISGKFSALSNLNICEVYEPTFGELHEYCRTVKGNKSYIANKDRPYSTYKGQGIAGQYSYSSSVLRYSISDYTTDNDERENIDKSLYPKGNLRNIKIESGPKSGIDDPTYHNFNVEIKTSWRTVSGSVNKSDKYGGMFMFMYVEPGIDYINLIP